MLALDAPLDQASELPPVRRGPALVFPLTPSQPPRCHVPHRGQLQMWTPHRVTCLPPGLLRHGSSRSPRLRDTSAPLVTNSTTCRNWPGDQETRTGRPKQRKQNGGAKAREKTQSLQGPEHTARPGPADRAALWTGAAASLTSKPRLGSASLCRCSQMRTSGRRPPPADSAQTCCQHGAKGLLRP